MACCKVGCNKPVVQKQSIVFQNLKGVKIRTEIGWCEEHAPTDAVCNYDDCNLELLKANGGGY